MACVRFITGIFTTPRAAAVLLAGLHICSRRELICTTALARKYGVAHRGLRDLLGVQRERAAVKAMVRRFPAHAAPIT